jgi:hypothetical protein
MTNNIPVIVQVKKAARFPYPILEVPEGCLNDTIKLGAKARVSLENNKLIYDFGETNG